MAGGIKINDDGVCYVNLTKVEVIDGKIRVTFTDGSIREDILPTPTDYSTAIEGKADKDHTHLLADITDFDPLAYATAAQGTKADTAAQPGANLSIFTNDLNLATSTELTLINDSLAEHLSDTLNPHGVTKGQVGLGSADNTSDVDKPVSTLQQQEITNKYNAAISYINSKLSTKVDKVAGSRLITDIEGIKLSKFDEEHYRRPVADLTALEALPQTSLFDRERRYVASEGVDYFYHQNATSGDLAPGDQVNGSGFWKATGTGTTTVAYNKWILNTGGTFRKNMVSEAILDLRATGLMSVAYSAEGIVTYTTSATQNSTDAQLRDRATHTGEQAISTVTNLITELDARIKRDEVLLNLQTEGVFRKGLKIGDILNLTSDGSVGIEYTSTGAIKLSASTNNSTLTDTSTLWQLHTEGVFRENITAGKVLDVQSDDLITVNHTSQGKVKIGTQATKNAPDAELRDRNTHTGEQSINTITNLETRLTTIVIPVSQAEYDDLVLNGQDIPGATYLIPC